MVKPLPRLRLQGFNNLTKALSFNIYDVCYARTEEERQRYIETVQDYNTYIRSFPQNLVAMMFGYKQKPNFSVENEQQIQQAPTVDFGTPAAPPAPAAQPAPTPAPAG